MTVGVIGVAGPMSPPVHPWRRHCTDNAPTQRQFLSGRGPLPVETIRRERR